MNISIWEFEQEFNALIDAALEAHNKETARQYLVKAENKIYGYDNIPYDLQQKYRNRVETVRYQLDL